MSDTKSEASDFVPEFHDREGEMKRLLDATRGLSLIYLNELEELKTKHERVLQMLEIAKTALEVYAMTDKTFPEYGTVARDVLAQIESLK